MYKLEPGASARAVDINHCDRVNTNVKRLILRVPKPLNSRIHMEAKIGDQIVYFTLMSINPNPLTRPLEQSNPGCKKDTGVGHVDSALE